VKTPRLSEVCKLVNGGTPKSGVAEYWGGEVAWLTPAEMGKRSTPYIAETARTISRAGLANCSASQVAVGAVIMSTRAPIGHLVIPKAPMAFNQGCRALIPNELLDTKYLYYFLWFSRDSFNELGTGTTFKELSSGALGNYRIPLPSIEEQRRIVAALDGVFAAIATATASAEKNLTNVEALLEASIASAFSQHLAGDPFETVTVENLAARKGSMRTGPFGSQLLHSEFVDAGVAVLGIDNAVANHFQWGKRRFISEEKFRSLSRFLVHPGDVIITIMGTCGRCAVIPDDIPRAINSKHLFCISLDREQCLPDYLHAYFLYAPDARKYLEERAQGSIMAGLNMGIIKEMPLRLPSLEAQQKIIVAVDRAKRECVALKHIYKLKLQCLTDLKRSLLQIAFDGELNATATVNTDFATPQFTAQVIAFAHHRHELQQYQKTFGHVKAQKALHMVEAVGGIDLGRYPIKDAAGPNDFQHMLRATDWAVQKGFFEFVPRASGNGYDFKKLSNYQAHWTEAVAVIRPVASALERAIDPIVPMVSLEAEVFATVLATWNNLLRDGVEISDDIVVKEAREGWHSAKLKIPEAKFRTAIRSIRAKGLVPDGTAKYVGGQGGLF